jgi:hypothetical protein
MREQMWHNLLPCAAVSGLCKQLRPESAILTIEEEQCSLIKSYLVWVVLLDVGVTACLSLHLRYQHPRNGVIACFLAVTTCQQGHYVPSQCHYVPPSVSYNAAAQRVFDIGVTTCLPPLTSDTSTPAMACCCSTFITTATSPPPVASANA